ncbi:transporter substrate-binding domain-containing protein [Neisseriaceae bacterium ESL0693]|nr:transporter substrate-binding domain-containing protein [Neisseriaceae bacterium ESL0693]
MYHLKRKTLILTALLAVSMLSACGGDKTSSASRMDTLQKIKDSGTIVLGYRDSSVPFSYIANQPEQPVGYAHDLQLKIVDAVKEKLNMPDLKIRYASVTSQNRIPLVLNGSVDIECGSTTNNAERAKQVDFSDAFFEVGTRLMVDKNSGIKGFADLSGKTVVTTAGTTSERLLRAYNEQQRLSMNIISAKEHSEAFLMLQNGRAQAFMMDDVLLAGERAKAAQPDKWVIVGEPMSFERYGCMIRKNDPAFKAVVDGALQKVYQSGQINQIYHTWFEEPIAPKGINLQFPMSEQLKNIFEHPTDQPV